MLGCGNTPGMGASDAIVRDPMSGKGEAVCELEAVRIIWGSEGYFLD